VVLPDERLLKECGAYSRILLTKQKAKYRTWFDRLFFQEQDVIPDAASTIIQIAAYDKISCGVWFLLVCNWFAKTQHALQRWKCQFASQCHDKSCLL
jgi:hypothetical protein